MRLKFSDLFEDKAGTPGYSAHCEALHGKEVEIAGYVAGSHDGSVQLLVAEPGGCPHCSQVPAVSLPEFKITAGEAVNLRGKLSFGFKVDAAGNGSMLRLEGARVATGIEGKMRKEKRA